MNDLRIKACSKCKTDKDISAYHKDKHRPDGLSTSCRQCRNVKTNEWNKRNKVTQYAKNLQWRKDNPEAWAAHKKKDYFKHREKRLATDKKRKKETHYSALYESSRKKTDLGFKLRLALRKRIQKAVRNNQKAGSAVSDLGCSIPHLKLHLELFWDRGMAWNNYGNKEGQWSIDHIKPLASFDLTDRSQFLEACHYTNLQPLWHVDNMCKHDKII